MIVRFFYTTSISLLLFAQSVLSQQALTVETCFTKYPFFSTFNSSYTFAANSQQEVRVEKGAIVLYKWRTDSLIEVLVPAADLKTVGKWDDFTLSENKAALLFQTEAEPVYRHSVRAKYWVYYRPQKRLIGLWDTEKVQYATLSPQGDKVAFVVGNNLYIKDLISEKTAQVTTDGAPNQIINGLSDWLYEEEFSSTDSEGMVATTWSPDGQHVAFLRFDERDVPEMQLTWYEGKLYPRYSQYKYPKVGQPNSRVSAHIYSVRDGRVECASTPHCGITAGAARMQNADYYLPRLYWTPENQLCIYHLNRRQDTLRLSLYQPQQRTLRTLHTEIDAAYVDLEVCGKPYFLKNGQYVWLSERDGYTHAYLQSAQSSAPARLLTPGNMDIMEFYGVDEANQTFYYQTASPTPRDRQVWEGYLDGRAPRPLTTGTGTFDATFTPTFDQFVCKWSDENTPPVVTLRARTGAILNTLDTSARARANRIQYRSGTKKMWSFNLPDGTPLYGSMLQPINFDPSKRYPVLFDVYGGPNTQTAQNRYDGYMDAWRNLLAQKGYLVVTLDNRGTGGRGRAFKKVTQGQLGKLETQDQIAAARYLATLPYVDGSRIGIWGWSFGGYLSTSCVLKGADVFKMAIAVAPVTNWKWYDSAYTERYMHTMQDNAAGYEENSPVNFAHLLRGDNYLLCHGMADDNVHWQQAVEITNALIKANKQFDTYGYPNRNHGIYGENATIHLFTKLTDFILEKL